jgi:hypothetical protein
MDTLIIYAILIAQTIYIIYMLHISKNRFLKKKDILDLENDLDDLALSFE